MNKNKCEALVTSVQGCKKSLSRVFVRRLDFPVPRLILLVSPFPQAERDPADGRQAGRDVGAS